jgi:hypothetical protein
VLVYALNLFDKRFEAGLEFFHLGFAAHCHRL